MESGLLIVFTSRTGNVRRFVQKLPFPSVEINRQNVDTAQITKPFVFVTYTTGFGQVPIPAAKFIKNNREWLRGVAASGNRNWAGYFAKAADAIAEQYDVPILLKFELSGTDEDVQKFIERVNRLDTH